jgi:ABC-type enterochelin transport system permease subunit
MKHFTKQIHSILYGMHDLLWVIIGLLILLSLILIASTGSLPYLFLFVPSLVYLYYSKHIKFFRNKHTKTGKKS